MKSHHKIAVFTFSVWLSCFTSANDHILQFKPVERTSIDSEKYPRCDEYASERCINLRGIPDIDESESQNKEIVTPAYKSLKIKNYRMNMTVIPDSMTFYSNITVNDDGKILAAGGPQLQFVSGFDQANSPWERRYYSRFGDSFRNIRLIDNKVFAVGASGVIYRTLNWGKNWDIFNKTYIDPYVDQDLNNQEIYEKWVQFREKTEELKFKYSEAYSIAFDSFQTESFKNGVVVGFQKILRSTDTGQTWDLVNYSLPEIALQEATFSEKNHVWAVGSQDTVILSKDAGKTWEKQASLTPNAHWLTIDFSNKDHGCLAGSGEIWCTENAGQRWQKSSISIPKEIEIGERISRLRWLNDQEGWAVFTTGQILKTENAGKNWSLWYDANKIAPNLKQVQFWGLFVDKVNQKIYSSGALLTDQNTNKTKNSKDFPNGGFILTWQK